MKKCMLLLVSVALVFCLSACSVEKNFTFDMKDSLPDINALLTEDGQTKIIYFHPFWQDFSYKSMSDPSIVGELYDYRYYFGNYTDGTLECSLYAEAHDDAEVALVSIEENKAGF